MNFQMKEIWKIEELLTMVGSRVCNMMEFDTQGESEHAESTASRQAGADSAH